MRSHAAFGASGHDEADSLRLLRRKMAPEQQAQRKRGVATRKVVDETISLRLRQHGNDAFGVEAPRANRGFDTADVVRRGRGDAMDEGAACHGNLIADAWVAGRFTRNKADRNSASAVRRAVRAWRRGCRPSFQLIGATWRAARPRAPADRRR